MVWYKYEAECLRFGFNPKIKFTVKKKSVKEKYTRAVAKYLDNIVPT